MNKMLMAAVVLVSVVGCGQRPRAEAEDTPTPPRTAEATQLPATRTTGKATASWVTAVVAKAVQQTTEQPKAEAVKAEEPVRVLTVAELVRDGGKLVDQVVRVTGEGYMEYPGGRIGGQPSGNLPPHPVYTMPTKNGRVVVEMGGHPGLHEIPKTPVIEGRVVSCWGGLVAMRFGEFVK